MTDETAPEPEPPTAPDGQDDRELDDPATTELIPVEATAGRIATGEQPVDAEPLPRRVPRLLVAALVVALLAGAGAGWLAWNNHQTGLAWKDRHERTAATLAAAEEQLASTQGDLADATSQVRTLSGELDRSEDDVVRLEDRIDVLANEKAAVEDQRNAMVVEAASWRTLAEQLDDIAAGMDGCIDLMSQLSDMHVQQWNDALAGYYVDVGPINQLSSDVFSFCDQVRQDAWVARQFVDELQ